MTRNLRSSGHQALMEALAALRREQGLTQQQLAARLRRPQSFVAKIEGGERRLEVVEAVEVALALGVAPDRLTDPILRSLKAELQELSVET